jgi:hypothetical protein
LRKLTDFKRYEESPFEADIKKGHKSVVSSHIGETYSKLTGELIHDRVSLVVSKSLDRSEFVKMFTGNINLFFAIGESEIKVFFHLLKNMEMNTGKAKFYMDCCKDDTGYSKVSVYKAMGLLCSKSFIARSLYSHYYWINPSIAFNGSRMSIKINS